MNRQIKFRVFNGDQMIILSSTGVQNYDFEDGDVLSFSVDGYDEFSAHERYGKRDYPIMQFTGLLDKNGKEIYEGDIIDINQTVNGQSKFLIKACLPFMDVRYLHDNRPYEYTIHDLLDAYRDEKEIEIIGNIYENPELLK